MKKLLGIVVLGLLWCNVGFANSPYIFFDVEFGSTNLPSNVKTLEAVGDNSAVNRYTFKPKNPNKLFDKYYVSTSAISQTIVRIIAKSTPYYSDKQKCDQKMHWLRDKVFETKEKNNLETRYTFSKKEYPTRKKYIILINDKLMQWDTQVHFFCERSPSNTAYNARLNVWNQTLSSRLSEEWDEFRKQKINTKGFE